MSFVSILAVAAALVAPPSTSPAPGGPPSAPAPIVVQGTVAAAIGGAPVAAARVTVPGLPEVRTGSDGRFSLRLLPGDHEVRIVAQGFKTETLSLKVAAGETPRIEVFLIAARAFEEKVDVFAAAGSPATLSVAELPVRPADVMTVAGSADNIFHTLQTLPGVAATNDFDSRLSVRGGGPDENLTVMDGVEIHNPYRLFGLTSAFNPETVKTFDLSAGAFGARYGDRLSSLLVVENRPGTEKRGLGGSAAMSLTDGNMILEGRLPGGAKGSWLVAGRRTYYDLVANSIVDTELPSFGDVQSKVVWELSPGRRLTFTGLISSEAADSSFEDDTNGDTAKFLADADNDVIALNFETPLGKTGRSQTVASWYRNGGTYGFDGSFQDTGRRSNAPDGTFVIPPIALAFTEDFAVEDLALREDLLYQLGSHHVLGAGFELRRILTKIDWTYSGDHNPYEGNGSSAQGGSSLPTRLHSQVHGARVGGWVTDRITAGPFTVEPGVRLDWTEINEETTLSPRLSTTLRLGTATRVRAGVGLYQQSPGYEKMIQADYFVELKDRLDVKSARAMHYVLGLEHDFARGFLGRVEGYYKDFSDLMVGRLETEGERLARVATYAFPAEYATSVPIALAITSDPVNGADGYSYGVDAFVSKQATSAATRLSGWASYSYGHTKRHAYGQDYLFDYDRPHALAIVAAYRMTGSIDVSATYRISSGFPMTPTRGIKVLAADELDASGLPTGRLVPLRDSNGLVVWGPDVGDYRDLNSGRFPAFQRLDLRFTFHPGGRQGRWQIYADVINATNHKNASGYELELEYDPSSDRPFYRESTVGSIPFLPSVGVRYRF